MEKLRQFCARILWCTRKLLFLSCFLRISLPRSPSLPPFCKCSSPLAVCTRTSTHAATHLPTQYAIIYHFWDNYRFVLKVDFIEVCSILCSLSWFTFSHFSGLPLLIQSLLFEFYYGTISIQCKNVCVVRPKSNSASLTINDDDDDNNNSHHHRRKIIVFCSTLSSD